MSSMHHQAVNPAVSTTMPRLPQPEDRFVRHFPNDWTGFTQEQQKEFRTRVEESERGPRTSIAGLRIPNGFPLLWGVALRGNDSKRNFDPKKDLVWQLSRCPPAPWRKILRDMLRGERESAARKKNTSTKKGSSTQREDSAIGAASAPETAPEPETVSVLEIASALETAPEPEMAEPLQEVTPNQESVSTEEAVETHQGAEESSGIPEVEVSEESTMPSHQPDEAPGFFDEVMGGYEAGFFDEAMWFVDAKA